MDDLPLRPNPGPELLPPEPPFLAYLALAFTALLLAAFLLLVVRWLRRPRRGPVLSPEVQAHRELESIAASLDTQPDAAAKALGAVANVLRRYLHARYQLPAPEQTTEEFRTVLAGQKSLAEEQRKSVLDVLGQADLVKFARLPATTEEVRKCIEQVRTLVARASALST